MKKKMISCMLSLLIIFSLMVPANAASPAESMQAKMDAYTNAVSVNGTPYWNACVRSADSTQLLKNAADQGNYLYGITNTRCSGSNAKGSTKAHLYQANGCTSNIFSGAAQCHGFALYFCYVLYGTYPSRAAGNAPDVAGGTWDGWTYYTSATGYPGLKTGDFIRFSGTAAGTHSAVVYSVNSDNSITVINCNNVNNPCVVRKQDLWKTDKIKLTENDFKSFFNAGHAYICRHDSAGGGGTSSQAEPEAPKVKVTVTTSAADSITQNSAVLYGSAKSANGKMTQCGMKIGTSESNMTKLGSDTINSYSTSMWYSTSKYGYTLQPGTTYYYRAYAVVGGVTYDGNTLSFTTQPAATPEARISLNKSSLSIQDNACAQLTATTTPSGQAVSWTSSNPSVATVNSSGGVTGWKAGTTTITASMTYGGNTCFASCKVTVTATNTVTTASISLNKSSLSLKDTACAQLTATTTPSGQAVSWTSSNPSVATVNSSGGVTGLKAGTTTITASMTYGGNTYFASCKVTVTAANSVTYTVSGASSITQSTARVDASCYYTGTRPTTVGLYLGTSKSTLSNYGSDTLVSTATNNPVSVWYNLNNLSAGTTYYYQFYAVANGTTYTSDILSFTTTGEVRPAAPQKPTVWVGGSSVTVTWNAVANAQKYDVYLVQSPWGWEDVKYSGSTTSTSYAFTSVADGYYNAFVIARPNADTVQSEWADFTVSNNTSGEIQIEIEGPITIVETPVYSGTVTGTGSSYLAINDKPAASPTYSNQIGSIPPGGTVKVYPDKRSGNWYYVSYNGVSGYAYSKYITLN